MVLRKILLVFDPPGIGLVIVENNEDKIIHFNLTDLNADTNIQDLVSRILEGQPRKILVHKDAIHAAILKIKTKLICNHKYIQSGICLNHFLPITNIAINNFDTKCVTGSYDRTARIWDVKNFKELASLDGHSNVVFSVSFNGKSDKVLTGSFDQSSKIWDAITGRNLRTYWGHTGEVLVSAFLPDEEAIASCSTDGTIRVFQTETGQETATYMGHKKDIISLQMSAERNFVISGSFDRTIRIWDMRISACAHVLCGHDAEISSCKIAADSSLLVSGGFDGRAIVWDLRKMKYFKIFVANNTENNEKILDVDIKNDYVVACSSNSNAHIWSINTSATKLLKGHKKAVSIVNFNPNKDEIMTCSEDKAIRIWKLNFDDFSNDVLEHDGPVTSGIYSRNGQKVISICANNSCRIWSQQNVPTT